MIYCSEHARGEQNYCILILCISSISKKFENKFTKFQLERSMNLPARARHCRMGMVTKTYSVLISSFSKGWGGGSPPKKR